MTSTWRPTEGLKQAIDIVAQIETELFAELAVFTSGWPEKAMIVRHRVTEVIAKAIDEALGVLTKADAEKGAMANTFATTSTTGAYSAHFTNGNGHAHTDDYSELPMFMGATAYDQLNDPHVVPLDDHMPDAPDDSVAAVIQEALARHVEVVEAPKKRRGRPPGSKAKAKPAKKRKSAKAIRAELYPVEAPVAETVAPVAETVTEALAEATA